MARRHAPVLLIALALGGCGDGKERSTTPKSPPPPAAEMTLTSPRFEEGDELRIRMSCDGDDLSPPLRWTGVPPKTREIAVLMDDPDGRGGAGFQHWTLWGLPPKTTSLPEGRVPDAAKTANNSAGTPGYTGPCPPEDDGPHRYVFSVRALDAPIDAEDGADANTVREQIEAATIGRGELAGKYER